jgi:hypothetical protein
MNSAEVSIASAVRRIFRAQSLLYQHGKERYGDWHKKFADEVQPELLRAAIAGAKKGKASPLQELQAWSEERALWLARVCNDTTGDWIGEGREPFTADRVVMIAATEANNAVQVGFSMAMRLQKKRLRWDIGLRGKTCKACRKLAGVVRKPGQHFTVHEGEKVYNPPLHQNCDCKLTEV